MRSSNGTHIAVTLALGIGLFILALGLFPSRIERGMMHFRDKEFEKAFELFWQEYEAGTRKPTVVVSLVHLFLQKGEIDRAIRLMEEFSELRPRDTETLRALGAYYQAAQRPTDYTLVLEKIREIVPQESDLRALGDIYNFQARYEDQIGVLQELIDRGWGNARDLATLAYLYAANREVGRALSVFETVDAKNEGLFDHKVMLLRLSLLIDSGKIDEALSLSVQWRAASDRAPEIWEIAGLFASKGHPQAGLTLYETGMAGKATSLRSRVAYGALLVGAQRHQAAYDLLAGDITQAKPMPAAIEVYVQAAFGLGKVAEVLDILKDVGEDISDEVRLSAIEAAYHAGLFKDAQEIRDQMAPDSLIARPVLMSQLALAVGEESAARDWVRRAEATPNLTSAATLDLVALLVKFDRKASANHYLKALLSDPQLPGNLLFRAASLLVSLGEGKKEFATFAEFQRQRSAELEVNAAWALVASVAGKRAQVKEWLMALRGDEGKTGTLIDLYNMARDAREFELALNTALVLRASDQSTDSFMRLLQAQLDTGLTDELRRTVEAEKAVLDQLEIEDAARLGEILMAAGQFDMVLSALQKFSGRLNENPALLTVWSRAEIQGGLAQNAFVRLQQLADAGHLVPSVKTVFIESALAVNKIDVAWDAARGHMSSFPVWLQTGLVELLIAEKKAKDAEAALAELGDAFSRAHPLLPAELALLQGRKRDAVSALTLASSMTGWNVRETIKLGKLWLLADKRKEALNSLAMIESLSDLPHTLLMDVAHLYLKLDQIERGEDYFTQLRRRQHTHLASAAWALLAVGGKNRQDVHAWIRKTSFSISDISLLHDLYFASSQAKAFPIAKDIADKLWQITPSQSHRLIQAQALLNVGELTEALHAAQHLDLHKPQARQTYLAVLTAAVKAGLPGRNALVTLLAEDLASTSSKDQSRLIFDLFALKAHDVTLPYLAKLASTSFNWSELYWEALIATGREAEARDFLVKQAINPNVPHENRRDFASLLLSRDSKDDAARVYRELAALHGPKSQDMQNLLYLWGPRPFEEDIAWLVERAKNATGESRVDWLDILIAVGGGRKVADLAKAWRASETMSSGVRGAAVRALNDIGAIDELKEALAEALRNENDPTALREYTVIAWDRSLSELAYLFGKRLLAIKGEDAQTLKILGYIAYAQEDFDAAKTFLSRYLSLSGTGDFQSHFYLAEILGREGNALGAADYYLIAVDQIEAVTNPNFFMAHLRGLILQRLRRYDEAIVVFETMLEKNPDHEGLRSDLAETLLLRRSPARAYTVINSGRRR